MLVFTINKHGEKLMPCKPSKAIHLPLIEDGRLFATNALKRYIINISKER